MHESWPYASQLSGVKKKLIMSKAKMVLSYSVLEQNVYKMLIKGEGDCEIATEIWCTAYTTRDKRGKATIGESMLYPITETWFWGGGG